MDRLVELFKNADEESAWVRVPVVNYLRACPLPEAKERMAELEAIDPDAVKRANSFFPLATAPAAEAEDGEPAVDPPVPPPAAPANDVAASSVSNGDSAADEADAEEAMSESADEPTDEPAAEAETANDVATSDERPADEQQESDDDLAASEESLAAATPADPSGGGDNPGGLSGTSYLLVVTLVPLAICLVLLAVLRIILRRPRRMTT